MRRQVVDALGHLGADRQDFMLHSDRVLAQKLNQSLDDAGAVQIHSNFNNKGEASVYKLLQAHNRRGFDKLLAQVVTKLVGHDVRENVHHDMDEGSGEVDPAILVNRRFLFKPFLDHSAASLVKG